MDVYQRCLKLLNNFNIDIQFFCLDQDTGTPDRTEEDVDMAAALTVKQAKDFCCEKHFKIFEQASKSIRWTDFKSFLF